MIVHFYPRSPCGERLRRIVPVFRTSHFYPRSPCGERLHPARTNVIRTVISIHVPLAGNVIIRSVFNRVCQEFLSTFPLRGTSIGNDCVLSAKPNFYPRSPCGERPDSRILGKLSVIFLSTFPLRGTSRPSCIGTTIRSISIHVPLAGNVALTVCIIAPPAHFYPRSPCGERLIVPPLILTCNVISIHVPLAGNVP